MYQLRAHKKKWVTPAFVGKMAALAVVVGFAGAGAHHVITAKAAPDPSITVEALWPTNNTVANGTVTLKFTTKNLPPSQYEPFWSVDDGTWNRMQFDPNNASVAYDTVDISNWKWKADNKYKVSYIALVKGIWQPVSTSVTLEVGTPQPAAAAAPAAPTAAHTAAKAAAEAAAKAAATAQAAAAATASAPAAAPAPQVGGNLFADPNTSFARNALALAAADPANAGALRRLAATPVAAWFGGWSGDVRSAANAYVSSAAAAGKVPVLVAYNIPGRDCGSYSAGGAGSAGDYLNWVRNMAAGIGARRAMVILEPDSLAQLDCVPNQAERISTLSQAVSILKSNGATSVYMDGGNPNWQPAGTMAARLNSANVGASDGFALNVSNFTSTADNLNYGTQISRQTSGKHFVIDTSRNGNGSNGEWCNPAGRALGQAPTTSTGNGLADAFLYIKAPGESDGTCGPAVDGTGAPGAGAWWPQYAIQLLRNAGW